VESHDRDHAIFGEGFLAHNQATQMGAERYDLHPSQYHVIHVLDLQRGDLHKEYQLNSEDPCVCAAPSACPLSLFRSSPRLAGAF
jgi:hypothetical protein